MRITAKVEGGREVAAMLKRVDRKVRGKLLRDTVKRNAKPVLQDVRASAPEDSGALRKSFVVRVWSRASQGYFFASVLVNPKVYRSQRTVKRRGVGAAYQPDWVQRYYRWTIIGATVGKSQPVTIPANPYPERAAEKGFQQYREGVIKDLQEVIRENTR